MALHHEPDRAQACEACVAAALQDKNPGPDARAAVEAPNKAHRELKDPGSRVCKNCACMLRPMMSLSCNCRQLMHALGGLAGGGASAHVPSWLHSCGEYWKPCQALHMRVAPSLAQGLG